MSYFNVSWIWSLFISTFSFPFKNTEVPSIQGCSVSAHSELTTITTESKQSSTQQKQAEAYWQSIPRALGFQFHKKKLVLDLDETLISSSQKHCFKHDISVQITINGSPATFFVRKRPHVDLFLETVSQWFELVIFTASLSVYANAVIDQLDLKRRINRRYYRQSCVNKAGSYIKDLQTVCKDLSKVVIVDNSPLAYSFNKENGIAIPDYLGTNNDDESLLHLLPLLEQVRDSEDVRHALKLYPNGVCGVKSTGLDLFSKISNSF